MKNDGSDEYVPSYDRKERKLNKKKKRQVQGCRGKKGRKVLAPDERKTRRKPRYRRESDGEEDYPYECKKCGKVFMTERGLTLHTKQRHGIEVEFELQYNYSFDKISEMFTCKTCDKEYTEEEEIKKHCLSHEDTLTCEECQAVYYQPYDFSIHVWKHCGDKEVPFRCPLCDYTTKARNCLLSHVNRSHLNKHMHTCDICSKHFHDVSKYKDHLEFHKTGATFSCVVCNKSFAYNRYLVVHQLQYHRVGYEGVLLPNECPQCNRVFAKEQTLSKHVKARHTPRTEPRLKTHLCDMCGKGFPQQDKLDAHIRMHTGSRPYKCDSCGKGFTKREFLTLHERTHTGEKPYSCEYCGKSFSQGSPLRIHVRSHTGERPYVCPSCGFGFASRAALNVHVKTCLVH